MIETVNALIEAITKALEKMAFLTVWPMTEDMAVPEKTILTQITFSGHKSGTIQMLADSNLGKVIAENMGADRSDDEVCRDALKELTNVTCGLFLQALGCSSQDIFDVTVPLAICGSDLPLWDEFTADADCLILNVEGYLVAAKLTYK